MANLHAIIRPMVNAITTAEIVCMTRANLSPTKDLTRVSVKKKNLIGMHTINVKRNDICTTIFVQLSLSYSHYLLILSLPFSLSIVFG